VTFAADVMDIDKTESDNGVDDTDDVSDNVVDAEEQLDSM